MLEKFRANVLKFSMSVCPVIDNEIHHDHNIVKVVCRSTRLSPRGSTADEAL